MNCRDVGIEACSRRPLCPCFQEWDDSMWAREMRVLCADRIASAHAGLLLLAEAARDANDRFIVQTAVRIARIVRGMA